MTRFWAPLAGLTLLAASAYPGTYILQLSTNPLAEAPASRSARMSREVMPPARTQRARVLLEQNRVRAAIAQRGTAVVLDAIDTVGNDLIVSVPDDQVDTLRSIPGVVRIYKDRQYKLLLNRALPLVHAPEAWFLVGGSGFAGAGAKIAIIDTGVDQTHPALQDTRLRVPDGFPKGNKPGDLAFTNSKVIVARSYENLNVAGSAPADPVDELGHGTAVAGTAAAAFTLSPLGLLSGVAPQAWIGNYKVFRGATAPTSAIAKAIDDAVKDGMDVINMSLGSPVAERSADSLLASHIASAVAQGVVVAVAAGNSGPDPATISDIAVSPEAIAAGATSNDRTLGTAVTLDGAPPYQATPASVFRGHAAVTGPLFDIASLDPSGLACNPLTAGSLSGRVALVLRGTCTFEIKLDNLAAAGATAAVIYTSPDRDVGSWTPGQATLPGVLVSNAAGLDMKSRLAGTSGLNVTVQFSGVQPFAVDPNTLASFSGVGPSADIGIKPDMLGVGLYVYMPTLRTDATGTADLFDASGFVSADGTSFASPMVAGAAAVLKTARRGLTGRQYRSLLVNSAGAFVPTAGPAGTQQTGAGFLNVENSVVAAVAAYPTSLSFGAGPGTASLSQKLTLTNVGVAANTFAISVEPKGSGPAPVVTPNTVQLAQGASADVQVQFSASGLPSGEYQGLVIVHPANSVDARIPYWYAVPSGVPHNLTVLDSDTSDPPGVNASEAILFRVTDATGIAVSGIHPAVTVVSGTGTATPPYSVDPRFPGVWAVDVKPGPGTNTFQIQVGSLTQTVSITGQ